FCISEGGPSFNTGTIQAVHARLGREVIMIMYVFAEPKVNSVDDSGRNVAAGNSTNTAGSAPSAVGPTLGGLFAGGFPVLKPVGQRDKQPHHNPVSRSGSTASLKQPLWNPPSQEDGFRGSAPDLSPSHKPLERASSLSKTRPISSYTAPPSPSQTTHPSFKLSSTPPSSAPPPPPQERPSNRPPPLPTCLPPPPPPQMAKPTWLPVQSHSIPMPTSPPPPLPPSVPASSGVFFPPPPSPGPLEMKDSSLGPPPPPPPPLPASFACSHLSSAPPPLPQKVPPMPSPTYRPSVPLLPPSYPCTAPSRRPPAVIFFPFFVCFPDDFESKFHFHPIEDFPPPEEFRPFPRTYPSKENRGTTTSLYVRVYVRKGEVSVQ
uniref:Formin-like protein 3 n=1 Tax=Sinocyclocheilus grahami TaxID=75366 RepID=A0A672SHX9_SINGR